MEEHHQEDPTLQETSKKATSLKALAVSRTDIFHIDPKIIYVDPDWNIRLASDELEEHIQGLYESIKLKGVETPLLVSMTDKGPTLDDGFCRMEAVRRLLKNGLTEKIQTVPTVRSPRYSGDIERTVSLFERNRYLPLNPMERAIGVVRLLNYGLSPQEIADQLNQSLGTIYNAITLAKADEKTKALVLSRAVSATKVVEAIRASKDDTDEAHKQILSEIKKPPRPRGRPPKGQPRPSVGSTASALSVLSAALTTISQTITDENISPERAPAALLIIKATADEALDRTKNVRKLA